MPTVAIVERLKVQFLPRNKVKEILRVAAAEPVMHGVLKLVWNDGYESVVDLRGIIARGRIFEPIRDPDYFRQVRVERFGHYIYWGDDEFTQIDFGCDRLREVAEEQAALLAHRG
jgi:Protein of unknown function (DUF2442)